MAQDIDVTDYTQLPIFDVAGGIALATSLRAAMPVHAPAAVKKSAEQMRASAEELSVAWSEVVEDGPDRKRPADIIMDRAWSSLFARVDAYAALPVQHYPAAARATDLLQKLFPDGLTFLRLPYVEEWAESDKRLKQIAAEAWAKDLDRVAGPEFLANVKTAHEAYGLALGITQPAPRVEMPSLAELLRELRKRMNRYVLTLLALGGDDDEAVDTVRAALRPIDEFRASTSARRSKANGDAGAVDEVPAPGAPAAGGQPPHA